MISIRMGCGGLWLVLGHAEIPKKLVTGGPVVGQVGKEGR